MQWQGVATAAGLAAKAMLCGYYTLSDVWAFARQRSTFTA